MRNYSSDQTPQNSNTTELIELNIQFRPNAFKR
jgi:hypothetical protein